MTLLGRANWWLPPVLNRHLPRIAAHAPVELPRQREVDAAARSAERV
jgi:hypothetical protein